MFILLIQMIQVAYMNHQILPWLTWADPSMSSVSTTAALASDRDPNPITTHILDTAEGVPAKSVGVSLYRMGSSSSSWIPVKSKLTNEDGRASQFLTGEELRPGIYKMVFNTGDYFAKKNSPAFHPFIEVVFEIRNPSEHYHIALTVSAFSYSTYRGS